MVKAGVYRTRTEAVRDAVRKLIEEKRKASVMSNGGEHEYF
jgi:Arc/MetJ-type ribon-helix-helix transcriptional regulator